MAQYIYLILAIVVMGMFSLTANRALDADRTSQALTETETLVTRAGNEILDQIGRAWFDKYAYANRNTGPSCGRLTNLQRNRLAAYGSFDRTQRRWIEGYHRLDTTLTRGGFDYRVRVRIRYVRDTAPKTSEADTLTAQSFAKEAVVTVTNPHLTLGSRPLRLSMARTYTYACPTNPNYVPVLLAGKNTCADISSCARP